TSHLHLIVRLAAHRQGEPELRAAPLLTLHPDAPAVTVDDLPANKQPQPQSYARPARVADAGSPVEALPNALDLTGGDARSLIAHTDTRDLRNAAICPQREADGDGSVDRR